MALRTAFTDMFGIAHPVALAPMGGSAGGALAAAVSNGGGLGLIGGGAEDVDWLDREAIDLINSLPPAADLVGALAAQAEQALAQAASGGASRHLRLGQTGPA